MKAESSRAEILEVTISTVAESLRRAIKKLITSGAARLFRFSRKHRECTIALPHCSPGQVRHLPKRRLWFATYSWA
jgi:hypothetical protein